MIRFLLYTFCALSFFCTLPFSVTAQAQSLFQNQQTVEENPVSRANEFFQDCAANPVFNVSDETNLENCACASAQVEIWENENNRATTSDFLDPSRSREELNEETLMLDIYAPCLYIPAREIFYNDCTADRYKNYASQGDPRKLDFLCTCVTNGMTDFYELAAEAYLKLRWSEGKVIYDPIEELKTSTDYHMEVREVNEFCFQTYYQALEKAK